MRMQLLLKNKIFFKFLILEIEKREAYKFGPWNFMLKFFVGLFFNVFQLAFESFIIFFNNDKEKRIDMRSNKFETPFQD